VISHGVFNPNLYRLGALSRSILVLVGRLKGYLFQLTMIPVPLKGTFAFYPFYKIHFS